MKAVGKKLGELESQDQMSLAKYSINFNILKILA
jgi:hypothetical protein